MTDSNKNEPDDPVKKAHPGNGDPVQRAARDARIKQALRENLKRRKQKTRIAGSKTPIQPGETLKTMSDGLD